MRMNWTIAALAMGLPLAGCGGGSGAGGGVSSTPTPPASYTKIAEMSGDRTFQTAGTQYTVSNAGFTNGSTFAFGGGVTVAYSAGTDSYKLTAPDGSTVTFTPANVATPPFPNSQQWSKPNGTGQDTLLLIVPTVNGVPLSYTIVGNWGHADTSTGPTVFRLAVGGAPTLASDMPRTGSATYSAAAGGSAFQSGALYSLNGNTSATFSANFASSSVTTALTLGGTAQPNGAVTQFGTFNGTGTISSSGPGFTGTLSGANGVTGAFSGAFFGPQALEMGYDWFMSGGTFSAVGTTTGVKQ